MKKLFGILTIAAILAASAAAHAEIGDVIGNVYSTDILAKVNGSVIPSYCLDGKTAIALRDLENYGFYVEYNDQYRTAVLVRNGMDEKPLISEVERGEVGEIIGNLLETDIVAYINGVEVPSYNIGGTLVSAIEDIAPWNDESEFARYGYAKTGMTYTWDDENRIVELLTIPLDNSFDAADIARETFLEANVDEGELQFTKNKFLDLYGVRNGVTYAPKRDSRIYPVYYTYPDGTKDEVGLMYGFDHLYFEIEEIDDEGNEYYLPLQWENYPRWSIRFDLDKVRKAAESVESIPRTFEEEIDFWKNGGTGMWRVTAQFDTEKYSILDMRQTGLPHGGAAYQTLRVDKEPLDRQMLMSEITEGMELYDDTLMYFKGSSLYEMDVYSGEEKEICAATTENVLNYLKEHWNVVYEDTDQDMGRILLLNNEEDYRIYGISTSGAKALYRGAVKEAYVKDGAIVMNDGTEWSYANASFRGIHDVKDLIDDIIKTGKKII